MQFQLNDDFFLSAMLFCWGVFGQVDWWIMPFEVMKEVMDVEKYPLALSLKRMQILEPNWVCVSKQKYLKIEYNSKQSFIKYNQLQQK